MFHITSIKRPFGSKNLRNASNNFNPLNAELNPIRHLLALVGGHHFVHVSRIRVNTFLLQLNAAKPEL
jgi:hypothetical protein